MILIEILKPLTAKKGVCIIITEKTPERLAVTGADVPGVADDYVFAAGSVIVAPDADYIAFRDGVFERKRSVPAVAF